MDFIMAVVKTRLAAMKVNLASVVMMDFTLFEL